MGKVLLLVCIIGHSIIVAIYGAVEKKNSMKT